MVKLAPAAFGLAILAAAFASGPARAGDVKEADATCYTATAILSAGDGQNEAAHVTRIRETLAADKRWTVVDNPPQNRVGEVAVVRFDVKHTFKGGPTVAYTVQCGHGGTCNDIANKYREKNPTLSPAPVVQCGDVSNVLVNPQVLR